MVALLFATVFAACSDSVSPDPEPELPALVIASVEEGGLTITIYADAPLAVGYNAIYLDVGRGDGDAAESATIHVQPVMEMADRTHAAPRYDPGTARGASGLFEGALIFTMPSGEMGTWRLDVSVSESASGAQAIVTVPVTVAQSSRTKVLTGNDGVRYILTWIAPVPGIVGMNDLVVALHRMENMMSFPPVTDATVEMEPSMPSMGHGSANNVHPAHEALGTYRGRINYSMSGDWQVDFRIIRGGASVAEAAFEVTIP